MRNTQHQMDGVGRVWIGEWFFLIFDFLIALIPFSYFFPFCVTLGAGFVFTYAHRLRSQLGLEKTAHGCAIIVRGGRAECF